MCDIPTSAISVNLPSCCLYEPKIGVINILLLLPSCVYLSAYDLSSEMIKYQEKLANSEGLVWFAPVVPTC